MTISILSILFDYQIIVTIIMILLAWKLDDWKNWRLYHPTMLFYMVFAFIYSLLTYNYPLWEFESPLLKTTFSDILISCVFVPATILIYLFHFPYTWEKRISYVLMWAGIYTVIEIVSYSCGFISYHHSWSIWWSLLFNCAMFPLLYMHHKKPLCATSIAVFCIVFGLRYWKIPINSMK